jgi:membrane complex biogenesis BtpA family protein
MTDGQGASGRFGNLFPDPKPVIAMAHLPALPGTPRHERGRTIDELVATVRRDVRHLLDGGVDAILFCNEDDRPYTLRAGPEVVAMMTRVIAELRPTDRPFGVDVLWDPLAAMAVARATGAHFVREVVTGVYESDMGLWAPDAGALLRYRSALGAEDVLLLANITPEFASPLGQRTVGQRALSAVVSSLVDALLIAGPMAGREPDPTLIAEAKAALSGRVPVLLNTGARADNIGGFLEVADGVIVGSALKLDGETWNPVDPKRVRQFMARVAEARV